MGVEEPTFPAVEEFGLLMVEVVLEVDADVDADVDVDLDVGGKESIRYFGRWEVGACLEEMVGRKVVDLIQAAASLQLQLQLHEQKAKAEEPSSHSLPHSRSRSLPLLLAAPTHSQVKAS